MSTSTRQDLAGHSKQGRFANTFYLHEARDPQVAQQLLSTLAKRRSGPPLSIQLEVERYEDSENIKMVLELTSQEHLADLVLLHGVHPQHGLGNVRIRHGQLRDKDLLVVQMVLLEYVQPKPIGGRAPTAGYQFKVTYTILKFNGATIAFICVVLMSQKYLASLLSHPP